MPIIPTESTTFGTSISWTFFATCESPVFTTVPLPIFSANFFPYWPTFKEPFSETVFLSVKTTFKPAF